MTLPPGLHTRQMTGGPLENMPELRISAKHESFLPHVNRVCGRRRVRAYAQQSLQADPSKRDSLLIPMKKGPSPMSNGTSLKPRDRVSMSLNHEKPDRCPMQISFTPEFAQRLRQDMHQGLVRVLNDAVVVGVDVQRDLLREECRGKQSE